MDRVAFISQTNVSLRKIEKLISRIKRREFWWPTKKKNSLQKREKRNSNNLQESD
jgi:hypothetical protein